MITGTIGLWVAYTLVAMAAIFLSMTKHTIFKVLFVGFAIWYGVAVYFVPQNFMGWPTASEVPDNARIISFTIREPTPTDNGGMFFWCNTEPDNLVGAYISLNPQLAFSYDGKDDPRCFKIPYDRELHKKLLEKRKQQQGVPGGWLVIKKGGKKKAKRGEGENTPYEKMDFKVINPIEILKKERNTGADNER